MKNIKVLVTSGTGLDDVNCGRNRIFEKMAASVFT